MNAKTTADFGSSSGSLCTETGVSIQYSYYWFGCLDTRVSSTAANHLCRMRREEKTEFIIYDTTRIACTWQKFPCAPNKCHGKCDFWMEDLNDLSRVYNDRPTQRCFSISTELKSIFCCMPQTTSTPYLYVKGWWQNCSKLFILGISRWPNLERRKGFYTLSRRHLCLNYVECDYHISVRLSIWRRRRKNCDEW